jgi:hypothetical protein
MKNIFLLIVSMVSLTLKAQYYYDDIIGTQEINNKMKSYLAAKVQSVTAAGYDPQGNKTTDFNEWQDVQTNNSVLKITTRNGQSVTRTYYQFDDKTRVINARDSSTDIQSVITYTYDANDNLINIKTTTNDPLHDFDQTKERQWKYTTDGKPLTMLLIVNGSDSMGYRFTLDEHKNVIDEMLYHRGGTQNEIFYTYEQHKIYYFYDDKNRLTDITKYNAKIDRLLPDYMFEYDEHNRVIQRITVLSVIRYDTKTPDYLIWRYGFNEKGLKTKEVLYGKEKELKGKIEYTYTFGQ